MTDQMTNEPDESAERQWRGEPAYAPIAGTSPLGPVWATVLVQILFIILAVIGSMIPVIVIGAMWMMNAGDPQASPDDFLTSPEMGGAVVYALLAQFAVWGALALLWTRAREKRSYGTIGLGGRGWSLRYGRGFVLGIGLAVLLVTVAGLLLQAGGGLPEAGPDLEALDWSRLMAPQIAIPLIMIILLFMFQATVEEVAFRGWMMSSIAARTSPATAIIVNSVVFGLMHAHVLMTGIAFGLIGISGLMATGLFLSVIAWKEGSIAGASGIHGGFNVTIIGAGLAVALVADADTDWRLTFSEVLNASTGLLEGEAPPVTLELFAQLIVMLTLSALAWALLRRNTRRDPR